jgi:hypothetical protein
LDLEVELYIYIQEVLGLNLYRDIGYSVGFPEPLRVNSRTTP